VGGLLRESSSESKEVFGEKKAHGVWGRNDGTPGQ